MISTSRRSEHHPHINRENCLKIVAEPTLTPQDDPPHEHWQQEFLVLCQQVCSWSDEELQNYARHFTRHLGGIDLYLLPVPNEALLSTYSKCYFFHNNQLTYIRFNGEIDEALVIPIENVSLFVAQINAKKTDPQSTFLHGSTHDVDDFNRAFSADHPIGQVSNYRALNDLERYLNIVHARLTATNLSSLCETERAKILIPIIVGIEGCSTGLHNRAVNAVKNFFLPQTLHTLLMRERMEIVDQLAREISSDVHWYAHAHTLANQLGFEVPSINEADNINVSRSGERSLFTRTLRKCIDDYCHPFFILSALAEQIKRVLSEKDYEGAKPEGYDVSIYQSFIDYLQIILGPSINFECLVIDEVTNQVTDLNWLSVKISLWSSLIEQKFFHQPSAWQSLIEREIYRDPLDLLQSSLCPSQPHELASIAPVFNSTFDVIKCLQFFTEFNREQKQAVVRMLQNTVVDDVFTDHLYRQPEAFVVFFKALLDDVKSLFFDTPEAPYIHPLLALFNRALVIACDKEPLAPLLMDLFQTLRELSPPQQLSLLLSEPKKHNLLVYAISLPNVLPRLCDQLLTLQTCLGARAIFPLFAEHDVLQYYLDNLDDDDRISLPHLIPLMTIIERFSPEKIAEYFKHQEDLPLLFPEILRRTKEPEVIRLLLRLVQKLNPEDQTEVLLSKEMPHDTSWLLMAIARHPQLFPLFVDLIRDKTPQTIFDLFNEPHYFGTKDTALILIARRGVRLLDPLLPLLERLPATLLGRLFTQSNTTKRNFLMYVLMEHSQRLSILRALSPLILTLLPEHFNQLFTQCDSLESNVLSLAQSNDQHGEVTATLHHLIRQKIINSISTTLQDMIHIHAIDSAPLQALRLEVLNRRHDGHPLILKEKFTCFAQMVLDLMSCSFPFHHLFSRTVRPSDVFADLDQFHPTLTEVATGGFRDRDMLMNELTSAHSRRDVATPLVEQKRPRI